ncbi:MAG: 4-hydroxy-tetrahydrodipicolinate synthase [Bacteroidales bacterium]|nr:4-hydroxy-tetrahydrodipicolinate synthase [Bacteroidales bacterium]
MKKILFRGAGPALVTPFKSDGSVDYEAYARLVKRQVEGGADFLVALATSAEAPVLSAEEKLKLLALTRENAAGLPIIVGAGSNSIPGTKANMELLKDADAWLIVVPFYNKPTQEGMYLYYKEICSLTDKPVIIYNVPGRTGANMLPETALRLAREVPGIVGTKEASGKFEQIKAIIDGAPEGFAVLSGDDDMTYDIIAAGGHGVVSVAQNVLPKPVADMTHLALEGRLDEAAALNAKLQPLFKGCFVESNPIPAKAALAQLGLCTKTMRLPLTAATEATESTIKEILNQWK